MYLILIIESGLLFYENMIGGKSVGSKVVAITGAGSGLGASLAVQYNKIGYHVILLGRTLEKLKLVGASFLNENYSIYTLDVSKYKEVNEVFEKIVNIEGDIDILVNNAGVGYFELLENLDVEQMDKMININLKGTIYCTQQVFTAMKKKNQGSIINIISTAGLEGKVNETVYCASKFGVKGFTESILKETKDTNIHIHGIYIGGMGTPFWVGTEQETQSDHLMNPDDVAEIIIANTILRDKLSIPEVIIRNY